MSCCNIILSLSRNSSRRKPSSIWRSKYLFWFKFLSIKKGLRMLYLPIPTQTLTFWGHCVCWSLESCKDSLVLKFFGFSYVPYHPEHRTLVRSGRVKSGQAKTGFSLLPLFFLSRIDKISFLGSNRLVSILNLIRILC